MSEDLQTFHCHMCGHCCQGTGGIIVSEPEWQRIAKYLNTDSNFFLANYTDRQGKKRRLKNDKNGYCLFFSKQGCSIHSVKPDICRAWPFFRGNIIDSSSWEMAQDYCPGIKADAEHASFAAEGKKYLREHFLIKTDKEQAANALCIEL